MWVFTDNLISCMHVAMSLNYFATVFYDASVHDDILFQLQIGELPFLPIIHTHMKI